MVTLYASNCDHTVNTLLLCTASKNSSFLTLLPLSCILVKSSLCNAPEQPAFSYLATHQNIFLTSHKFHQCNLGKPWALVISTTYCVINHLDLHRVSPMHNLEEASSSSSHNNCHNVQQSTTLGGRSMHGFLLCHSTSLEDVTNVLVLEIVSNAMITKDDISIQ
jgi:hypothetical protein